MKKQNILLSPSALLLGLLLLSCSCARLKYAFKKEISSPHVWAPVALAGVMRLENFDRKVSDWARIQNPLFGNTENADALTDRFNDVLEYEGYATLLLSPTIDGEFTWGKYGKKKGVELLAMEGGVRGTYETTQIGKKKFLRQRPSKQDNYSFPSGHASAAGAWRKAASNNLDNFDRPYPIIGLINQSLAFGTLWGRMEAGKHYPSDVLMGYALGSFITGFVWSATFMPSDSTQAFSITPIKGGTGLTYVWIF